MQDVTKNSIGFEKRKLCGFTNCEKEALLAIDAVAIMRDEFIYF